MLPRKPEFVAPFWCSAVFVIFVLAISFIGAVQSHSVKPWSEKRTT